MFGKKYSLLKLNQLLSELPAMLERIPPSEIDRLVRFYEKLFSPSPAKN